MTTEHVVLADTTVWVAHFRSHDAVLAGLLGAERVVMHPLVVGELAMGNLTDRTKTLAYLRGLPMLSPATDEEVYALVEAHRLQGTGLGWADVHLLTATRLSGGTVLSVDASLRRAASQLGLEYKN